MERAKKKAKTKENNSEEKGEKYKEAKPAEDPDAYKMPEEDEKEVA